MERGGHQREGEVAYDMGRSLVRGRVCQWKGQVTRGRGGAVWHGEIISEREGSLVKRGDHQREGVVAYDIRRSLVKGGVARGKGRSPEGGGGRL